MAPSAASPVIMAPPMQQIINRSDDTPPPPLTGFQKSTAFVGVSLIVAGSGLCAAQGASQMLCLAGGGTAALGCVALGIGASSLWKQED